MLQIRPQRGVSRATIWGTVAVWLFAFSATCGPTDTVKIEAQLLWGTNDDKSPDPAHKPVEADVERKLKDLPLKWAHYFVVNRQQLEIAQGASSKATLSEKCAVEVKNLGHSTVEVTHFGKGAQVWKGKQALPKGEMLVVGGNAPSSTSWLIVLKRTD